MVFPGDFSSAIGQRKFHEREWCLLSPWAIFVLVYETPDQASPQSVSLFMRCQHLCCEPLYTFNGTSVVCAQMIPYLCYILFGIHPMWAVLQASRLKGCSKGERIPGQNLIKFSVKANSSYNPERFSPKSRHQYCSGPLDFISALLAWSLWIVSNVSTFVNME